MVAWRRVRKIAQHRSQLLRNCWGEVVITARKKWQSVNDYSAQNLDYVTTGRLRRCDVIKILGAIVVTYRFFGPDCERDVLPPELHWLGYLAASNYRADDKFSEYDWPTSLYRHTQYTEKSV